MSMPVEAGTPTASPDNPLPGVYISLDTRVMTEMAIEMESTAGVIRKPTRGATPSGDCTPSPGQRILRSVVAAPAIGG